MFGTKEDKWTFQWLGKEWVKRPQLASKWGHCQIDVPGVACKAQALLTFLEPWEMRAKVLDSIILPSQRVLQWKTFAYLFIL